MAPVHATTTMRDSEEGEEPMTSTVVRGFNPNELEAVIKNIGKFDPAKHDPLDFLKNLEGYAEVYQFTDGDACVLLRMCLPDTLSGALNQKVKNRTANKSERKQALLDVLGVMSVNWDRISEMQMRKGEHPAAFSERLLETFKTFSGNPEITQNDISFKTADVILAIMSSYAERGVTNIVTAERVDESHLLIKISKCDSSTRSAVTMFVTPLSAYDDIIAKMTQFYNNNANEKKSHPVSAINVKTPYQSNDRDGYRKEEGRDTAERVERPPPYNPDNLPVCYSCGKEGHISRVCKSHLKRTGPKIDLNLLKTTVDRLSKENEELRSNLEKQRSQVKSSSA